MTNSTGLGFKSTPVMLILQNGIGRRTLKMNLNYTETFQNYSYTSINKPGNEQSHFRPNADGTLSVTKKDNHQ